jgi:hypothetical protein
MGRRPQHATETPEQAHERLERLIPRMTEAMREASLMAAMLRTANDDPKLRAALHGTPQMPGFNAAYHGILGRVVLALTSLLDDAARNRASVPTAMALLAQREVRRRLTREALLWPNPDFVNRPCRNARACVRERRRAEAAWAAMTRAHDWADRLDRLRHLRNERLTHALFDMPDKDGPLYGWLEEIRQQLRPIVVSLRFAVGGDGAAASDDKENEEDFLREAEEFWSALCVGTEKLQQEAEGDAQ